MMHRSSTRRSRAEQALLSRAATQHALLTGVVADSVWYSAHDPALSGKGKQLMQTYRSDKTDGSRYPIVRISGVDPDGRTVVDDGYRFGLRRSPVQQSMRALRMLLKPAGGSRQHRIRIVCGRA